MVDWSRIRTSLSDDTWSKLKNRLQRRWDDPPAEGDDKPEWSAAAKRRWDKWRAARAERDVLASYRADYSEMARIRWWHRLRAGVGLFFVIALMGAGLAMLVGLFFVGITIALETLV